MPTQNQKNRFDRKDSLELGEKSEKLFAQIARAKGWHVQCAMNRDNIDDHWDVELTKRERTYRVDVKAMKRLNRSDARFQDEWTWIELHGVRPSDPGWLLAGKAEIIAFECRDEFLLVERMKIVELVHDMVDLQSRVKSPNEAHYKIYSRKGRPDLLTLVEMKRLRSIALVCWQKPQRDTTK